MRNEASTYHTFHPDHLGSTSYVTGADGTVAQHVEYIPYGEVFVEERSGTVGTAYLFNAKELDEETGMYYYGARYLDPASAMWISVDPMWEKNVGASVYNYCYNNPIVVTDPDGRNPIVYNEEGNETVENGWYAYKDGSYYKWNSTTNIEWDNPIAAKDCPAFMKTLGGCFEEMRGTKTGESILDYFTGEDGKDIIFQKDNERNGINGSGNHAVFICPTKNDKIPTTKGDDSKHSPLWISVGHEMAHRMDYYERGDEACNKVNFGSEKNTEIFATHMENRMRKEANLPLRTHYNAYDPKTQILRSIDMKSETGTKKLYLHLSSFYNTDNSPRLPYYYSK